MKRGLSLHDESLLNNSSESDRTEKIARPQPYYDFEIAKICAWLKANNCTMHVKLSGAVEIRRKP